MSHPLRTIASATLLAALLVSCSAPTEPVSVVLSQLDTDKDGILDVHEGDADADFDGLPNWRDLDSDGDGLLDSLEAGDSDELTLPVDADLDGTPDFLDLDSDANGIDDRDEGSADTDGDGVHDAADDDDDGDGLPDRLEIHAGRAWDSDRDGTFDHRDLDSDGDGIPDAVERWCASVPDPCDTDEDGVPDVLDLDSDGDTLLDRDEAGADPNQPQDSDRDGRPDWRDRDADGDGLDDRRELEELGTDPSKRDTDGDGFTDAAELEVGTDPNDASSRWEGWYVEVAERTQREESLEFELGVERIDVVFLHNRNYMNWEFNKIVNRTIVPLVERLSVGIGDPAFAYVEAGGYVEARWGDVEDPNDYIWRSRDGYRPIFVDAPLTRSETVFVSKMHTLVARIDSMDRTGGREAPWESFVQLLEGPGRDAWCDGEFHRQFDLPPWVASPDDLFGGDVRGRIENEGHLGVRPGLGYRPFSRIVFVWFAGGQFIDPGLVHPDPKHASNRSSDDGYWRARPEFTTTPTMCPPGPNYQRAAKLVRDANAVVITIMTDQFSKYNPPMDPTYSISRFLDAVDTPVDLDGDGDLERPLLVADLELLNSKGEDPAITASVGGILERIENDINFDSVSLQVEGDTKGFVANISPKQHTGLKKGDKLPFALQFRGTVPALENDQVFRMALNVLTDGEDLVDRKEILVVVPGRSR